MDLSRVNVSCVGHWPTDVNAVAALPLTDRAITRMAAIVTHAGIITLALSSI